MSLVPIGTGIAAFNNLEIVVQLDENHQILLECHINIGQTGPEDRVHILSHPEQGHIGSNPVSPTR